MNKIGRLLSEIFFPKNFTCDLCGIETFRDNLCPDCKKTVIFNDGSTCPVCGRKNFNTEICLECKAYAPLFKKAVSPLVYDGGTKLLIAKFKNGSGYLKDYFANLIAEKLVGFPSFDCIVYVPMTAKAKYKRGYNQAELLAIRLGELTGIPAIKQAIIKQKETADQKQLNFKERMENLKTCFKVEKADEIKNKDVLLVDDVLTTGATAQAICKKLLKAGAKHIYLATVTSVEYKHEKKE